MANRTAVVIDDEVDITTYLSSILAAHDFETRVAHDATSGEKLIRESLPDLILIDLMMPGRSGVQLFSRLRGDEQTKHVPLIMVTGIKEQAGIDWGEIVDRLKARKPDGFIEKPIDPDKLMEVVDTVLAGQDQGAVVRG